MEKSSPVGSAATDQGQHPPPGWGNDTLSEFMESAHRNRFATFYNKRDWFQRLSRIDACFKQVSKNWLNPTSPLTPHLFLRSHAAFRAACEHALAGQVAEIFPEARLSLEYAGYAIHLHGNPELEEIWLRRHDDEAAMNAMKGAFLMSRIRKTIEKANRHAAKVFDQLYERAIDFSAHPNERALTGNMMIKEHAGRKEFLQIYLHGDGLALDHGLKTTAQAGVCALEIFEDVFSARFELLGVRAELLKIRKGL